MAKNKAEKKNLTTMEKITRVVVWLMLFAMVGTAFITLFYAIASYMGF
ncbi:DUF4044 domain-containing protein [Granulicatella seriolae]|uniref:DUF4044 domain-containing protein n=1 Tax=Granulicatella seriolae TaxID=2967226 RepID=A0ABT1WKJ0_9LACT|nr:DUF4044 domain-containing protein [Granulicatella seriolae]